MSRNGNGSLPFNAEAERNLLGSFILSEDAWDEASPLVEEADFSTPQHRAIFRACQKSVRKYGRADSTTTLEFLRRDGTLGDMRPDLLIEMAGGVPSPRNAAQYALIVKDNSVRRQLIEGSQEIETAVRGLDDYEGAVENLQRLLLRQRAPGASTPKTATEILASPPEQLDALTDPPLFIRKGTTVLASETKVGKTNLWLHIAWALTEGKALWGFLAPVEPIPVLLVELDLTEATAHRRLSFLKDELEWSAAGLDRFNVWCTRSLQLDTPKGLNRLRQVVQSTVPRPELVIIDNLNAAISGDPDKTVESRRAFQALRDVQEQMGISFGLTYELRKPPPGVKPKYNLGDLKGNNVVVYEADTVVMLRPTDESRRELELRFPGLRHCDDLPDDMVLIRKGLTFDLTRQKEEGSEQLRQALEEYAVSVGEMFTNETAREVLRSRGLKFKNEELAALIRARRQGLSS